jgi:hypothetical protein
MSHGRRAAPGVTAISIGRRGFARGYPIDDRRRIERIAKAAPPHGAESCRGPRPASNAALFDILRLRGDLIALALQSRAISEPRLSRETAILGFGQRLMRRLGGSLAARLVSSSLGLLRSTPLLISRLALDGGQYAARRQPQWSQR